MGEDSFGRDLIENLSVNNVDTKNVYKTGGISSGIAVIVIKDGNNMIIVDPGANFMQTPKLVSSLEDVIRESSIVILQLEIPLETVEAAIAIAKRHNVKVLLNPAPARKLRDEILSSIDIITPNETEAGILTGVEVTDVESAKRALSYLRCKGIEQVIITFGSKGRYTTRGVTYY